MTLPDATSAQIIWRVEIPRPGWSTPAVFECTVTDHGNKWWEHTHCHKCGADDTITVDQSDAWANFVRCTACGNEERHSLGD